MGSTTPTTPWCDDCSPPEPAQRSDRKEEGSRQLVRPPWAQTPSKRAWRDFEPPAIRPFGLREGLVSTVEWAQGTVNGAGRQ